MLLAVALVGGALILIDGVAGVLAVAMLCGLEQYRLLGTMTMSHTVLLLMFLIAIAAGTIVTALAVIALKRWAARSSADTVEPVPATV